jgi:hypothetical protein
MRQRKDGEIGKPELHLEKREDPALTRSIFACTIRKSRGWGEGKGRDGDNGMKSLFSFLELGNYFFPDIVRSTLL